MGWNDKMNKIITSFLYKHYLYTLYYSLQPTNHSLCCNMNRKLLQNKIILHRTIQVMHAYIVNLISISIYRYTIISIGCCYCNVTIKIKCETFYIEWRPSETIVFLMFNLKLAKYEQLTHNWLALAKHLWK